jgi:hypothetical protein
VCVDGDDLRAGRDAERADGAREVGARRQRMAAVAAGLGAAQVAVEVQVVGAGEVRVAVAALAGGGVGEVEADVDHDRRGGGRLQRRELGRRDQRRVRGRLHRGLGLGNAQRIAF